APRCRRRRRIRRGRLRRSVLAARGVSVALRRRLRLARALDYDLEPHLRPEFPERNLVAGLEPPLARDPHAVHVRPVCAPDVHEHIAVLHRADLCVPGGDIQVLLRIELEIAERMPPDRNHRLGEPLAVAGARAGQNAKVDAHGAAFISPDAVSCGAAPLPLACGLPNRPRAANTRTPNTTSATIVNSHTFAVDR